MKSAIFLGVVITMAAVCLIAAAAPTPTGKFLLLDNDQLIEGDVRRVDDGYSVRRNGGETIIPARRVIAVVADRHAAFDIMRQRSNTRDGDERLRLVHWCLESGLHN